MATEKNPEKKKTSSHNGGEMHFGLEVLLFIVAIFVIWILTGGAKKQTVEKPFIVPFNDPLNPGRTYGPEDLKSNYQMNPNGPYKTTN